MYINIIIRASYEGICIGFERFLKQNNTLMVFLDLKYWKSFMNDPLNIIINDFGIWLLGLSSVANIFHKGIIL